MRGAEGGSYYAPTASDTDGSNVPSPTGAGIAVGKQHPNLVTKANISELQQIDPNLSFDAACTMLMRGK